ncbi:Rho termination factor N-terminal domain-containing protein [Micromonospora sp. NPDC004336]
MTGPGRDVAGLVAALLRDLPAADLAALVEGRARLAVVPLDATPPDPPPGHPTDARPPRADARRSASARPAASTADPARARVALTAMSRRDDGTAYLAGWTARDLRALAADLGLRGVTGLRKAELVDRIVDRTIGYRLASTAIRRL